MPNDQDDEPSPMMRIITRLNTSELAMEKILPPEVATLTLGFANEFTATIVVGPQPREFTSGPTKCLR